MATTANTRVRIDSGGLLTYCEDVRTGRLGDLLHLHKMPKQRSTVKAESNCAR